MAAKKKAKKVVKKQKELNPTPTPTEQSPSQLTPNTSSNQPQETASVPPSNLPMDSTPDSTLESQEQNMEQPTSSEGQEQPSTPSDSSPRSPIAQATPAPLKQAWLILSGDKSKFGDRMALTDILNNAGLPADKKSQARGLWMCLADAGFILHPGLEDQYRKQKTCMFCGGMIITRATKTSREDKCDDCDYIYYEE